MVQQGKEGCKRGEMGVPQGAKWSSFTEVQKSPIHAAIELLLTLP